MSTTQMESIMKEARTLTQREMNDSKELFELFDSDGSGLIYASVIGDALRALGWVLTENEVNKLKQEVIVNGNDTMDFADFIKILSHKPLREPDAVNQLTTAFETFDKEEDGFISLQELRYMMTQMGEALTDEQVDEMLVEMVPNGDGKVRYEDLIHMMK